MMGKQIFVISVHYFSIFFLNLFIYFLVWCLGNPVIDTYLMFKQYDIDNFFFQIKIFLTPI